MKRILLNYTEAGELIDYALVSVGKIVLVSEQKGREMFREEFSSMKDVIEKSCFVDLMDSDCITTMVAYSTFTEMKEISHDRIQNHRVAA